MFHYFMQKKSFLLIGVSYKDEFGGLTSSSSLQLSNSSKLDCIRLLRQFVKALNPQCTLGT